MGEGRARRHTGEQGPLLINARAEKVTTSPAFRSAKSKRCLVPMDGYYEWKPNPDTPAGKKARKTPFFMYRADGEPLFMAGLWSVWRPEKDAAPLLSCTIITTDAVGELAEIHDRMPLVVDQRDWDRWLGPRRTGRRRLAVGAAGHQGHRPAWYRPW